MALNLWASMQQQGAAPFDATGVLAIVDEVAQLYHGERQFYLIGFSAGGHLAWYLIFTHPERLVGAILAGANYAGRGVTLISRSAARQHLPIRGLQGDRDSHLVALNAQWQHAAAVAATHGYTNCARSMIANARHSPFPNQVFAELMRIHGSKLSS